jgi:proteic killer suppression protein
MATDGDDASPQGPNEERAPPLYRDKREARFANGERVREFQAFEEQAKKRLLILRASVSRQDLISGCSGIQAPSFRTAFSEPPHIP